MALTLLDLDQDVKYYIINEFLVDEDKVVLYWIVQLRPYIKFIKNSAFTDFTNYAAAKGYIDLLQWALSLKAPVGEETCLKATTNGQLQTLQFLRGLNPSCPWNEYTCFDAAVKYGHLNIVQKFVAFTPPRYWATQTTTTIPRLIIKYDQISILEWYCKQDIFLKPPNFDRRVEIMYEKAISKGKRNILLWLLKNVSLLHIRSDAGIKDLIEEKYTDDAEIMSKLNSFTIQVA